MNVVNLEDYRNASDERPRRRLFGVRISTDHGKSWRTKVWCQNCINLISEPHRLVHLGSAGSQACDDCDALNFPHD